MQDFPRFGGGIVDVQQDKMVWIRWIGVFDVVVVQDCVIDQLRCVLKDVDADKLPRLVALDEDEVFYIYRLGHSMYHQNFVSVLQPPAT